MTRRPRLLDLFCCQGGASAGYVAAGFDVVGVDLDPQPHYPYDFVQADALDYLAAHGSEFDAFHASPPCQDHSVSRSINGSDHGTGWLLDATIDAFRQLGRPWAVENVGGADMPGAAVLCGASFGFRQCRHRKFLSSEFLMTPPCARSLIRHVPAREREIFGHHGNTERIRAEWSVPWMTRDGISQAIPPAFTEHVGEQLLAAVPASA